MNPIPLLPLALSLGCLPAIACGPAPAPQSPQTPPPAASTAPASPPEAAYTPFADPSFLTFQNQSNVFVRRTLALLWVLAAKSDPPGVAQQARLARATQALSDSEAAVASQGDPCKGGVLQALDRATADKGRLERQYLAVSEADGDNSDDAKALDAQVHILRDAIDELTELARPCPPAMFPDSDYEPQ